MKKATQLLCALFLVLAFAPSKAKAQSIEDYYVAYSYCVCGTYYCNVETAGYTPGQLVKIYWGDGTNDTMSYLGITAPDTAHWSSYHSYTAPGTYSLKIVLSDVVGRDSVMFSEEMQGCRFLPIQAVWDVNSNCAADVTDGWVYTSSAIAIDSAGITIDTIPMTGFTSYQASGVTGTIYTMRVVSPPAGLNLTCGSGIVHDTISPSWIYPMAPTRYFLYECAPTSVFDLGVSCPGRRTNILTSTATIWVWNHMHCHSAPATLQYDFSPKYSFSSIVPALSHTVSGTSVIIDIGSLSVDAPAIIQVNLNAATTLVMGDTANFACTVTPFTGDVNVTNNTVFRCDTIRMSYDPNRKSVNPSGYISAGTELEYMLEFENTGNDTAHNIHIQDTLSEYLDFNTFKGGFSSHKVSFIKYKDGGHNIVKFDFPNIMLPDSSHHGFCKGMVTFSIKAKPTLAPGTTITNRGGIYFDINEVVMTNTVYSHIPLPTEVKHMGLSKVELYPNPVRDVLHITVNEGTMGSVTIYNVVGQVVRDENIKGTQGMIDVSGMVPGIYYARVRGGDGVSTVKFEKQ